MARYVLPDVTLTGGDVLVIEQAALGFGAVDGDRLFLYDPAETSSTKSTITPRDLDASPAVFDDTVLLSLAATWKYEDSGADLGDAWRAVGFVDDAWSSGRGLLANDAANASVRTIVSSTGQTTHYFRAHFNFDGQATDLGIDAFVDDGAIFYLNGQEILRLNMPEAQYRSKPTSLSSRQRTSPLPDCNAPITDSTPG